ncbi:MAG: HAMP domain-containing histidine kinase [Microscillaceae bacterium]|nr:HAMP domain-containing histidine kinase [Microscillaceae bacterium]
MKKIDYYLIITWVVNGLAGIILGFQFGTFSRSMEREQEVFQRSVQEASQEAAKVYAQWVSHVSSVANKNTFDELYHNGDSSFVFIIAQSVQKYPLIAFQPDTSLPRLRLRQFRQFRQVLEESRSQQKGLQEFYLIRAIQFCQECTEKAPSLARVFPLDSLVRAQLKAKKIDTEVQIAFRDTVRKAFTLLPSGADSLALAKTPFRYSLTGNAEKVFLYFPHLKSYIWYQMTGRLVASLALGLIAIASALAATRLIHHQKKLDCQKNNFINNVSHEFKTPIATIAFAVANIENEQVLPHPEAILQFTKVIKDENKRLNAQVEKVLQAAVISQKALELKKEPVNMHQLINELADAYELKISARGQLHRKLNAGQAQLTGDAFHLSNVISNLLDNALKYSPQNLNITLRTESSEKGFWLYVSDQGQGIRKEDQRLIFDKFYRVTKGNLHEVKGFGLGLSYVKEIVEQHGGQVSLQSRIGKGSTFGVFLPFSSLPLAQNQEISHHHANQAKV